MKKTLRFSILSLLLMLCGSAMATDITISAADMAAAAEGPTTVEGITFEAAKNNGSTAPTFNTNGQDFRIYAKGSLSVSASQSITKMVFNISTQGKKRLAPITASVGTIAAQAAGDETVTWTGEATAIELTVGDKANYGSDGNGKAGQFDFESVTITLGEGGTPAQTVAAKPVITPNGGTFTDSQQVTITAASGATVYYALNNGAFQQYGAPFTLTETTTVKAYAIDESKDVKQSETVEATFTKEVIETISVAEALAIIANLADGGKTSTSYDVAGYIVNTPDFQRNNSGTLYGNVNFDMADAAGSSDNALTVFRAKNFGNVNFTEETINSLKEGDKVVVRGLLQKYVKDGITTPELSSCYLISVENSGQTVAAKPVITPNGGTFETEVEVTLSHSNPDAELYYSLNGGSFQHYGGPFTLTETTTVKAYAVDEECDVQQSETAEATFTKAEPQQVVEATCAEVINGQDGIIYQVKGKCTEIKNTTYGNWNLEDETGTIYIYGTLDADGKAKNFLSLGIEVGDIVTVQGPRKDFNGTIELVDVTVVSIEKGTTPEPVIEKISVAKALEIINGLEDGKTTAEEYDIEGFIVSIKEVSPKADDNGYGNATYDINDEAGQTENALTVFRGHYLDGELFTAENQIAVGEKVVVRGKLQRYVKNGEMTPEVAQNNYIVSKDTSTAISLPEADSQRNTVYSLSGQRVLAPAKGLYIINGKKMVVK